MNVSQAITARTAGTGVGGAGVATNTMSDATAYAIKCSKAQFIEDMRRLLEEAQRYLGDVSWRVDDDGEVIYGHRAILYARANAAFQSRYLNPNGSARLQAIMSGSSLSLQSPTSPVLGTGMTLQPGAHAAARSVPPGAFSVDSFASSSQLDNPTSGARSPIPVSGTESAFFRSLLDFFYTASTPMGEVFTFLFEDSSYIDKEDAMDRLSQDLLFMWRSKLFADMHIQLTNELNNTSGGDDDALSDASTLSGDQLFPAHRAVLAVRSPYFNNIFLSPFSDSYSSLFTLPNPPFTPTALHFVLAYLYTGSFSLNRTFGLAVAMYLYKCATYLSHDLLQAEVRCRITDMCHSFRGCCKTCRMRSVRTYVFAVSPEVNAKELGAQAKEVVLEHFGEVWGEEIGNLPYSIQKELLVDKCSRTSASNAAAAMKGIMRTRTRLASVRNAAWADHVKSMLIPLEDRIKHFLRHNFAEMATSQSYIDLVEGVGFSNDVLERLLALLVEVLTESNAASIYEILVGKLLLREEGIAMDARARLEDTRQVILKYIKSRWLGIKCQNGFQTLENWSLKELSDELERPVAELLESENSSPRLTTRTGLKLSNTKVHKVEKDAYSTASGPPSLRASVRHQAHPETLSRRSFSSRLDKLGTGTHTNHQALSDASKDQISGEIAALTINDTTVASSSVGEAEHARPADLRQHKQGHAIKALSERQSPAMTKAARLRQASTASKLSTIDKDSRATTVISRASSSNSLKNQAAQSSSSLVISSKGYATSPRSLDTSSARNNANTKETAAERSRGAKTPTSPNSSSRSRPPSVTSTGAKRRPSVSSIKSTATIKSTKGTFNKASMQQTAAPPLPSIALSSPGSPDKVQADQDNSHTLRAPPGVTLQVGIECVVTHGQNKFKATVRYLGKVYFDNENYVGVEVPIDSADIPVDLKWTDGTVDGVQYFALTTRKKFEITKARSGRPPNAKGIESRRSIPTSNPTTRGLFVKPSQVVYVF